MKIHYSTPYSTSKNFGGAINDFCELIKDPQDWIVIRDMDTLFVQTHAGYVISRSLELHGSNFGLIGCMTNRLRGKHQLHNGEFSNNHDIKHHYEIGTHYQSFEIEKTDKVIAGMFMAFQKKTFDLVGGFSENDKYFDIIFSSKILKAGLNLGIMKGLYIYHMYRIWNEKNPFDDYRHLEK
jgi:GT2 family glycosyltransferase